MAAHSTKPPTSVPNVNSQTARKICKDISSQVFRSQVLAKYEALYCVYWGDPLSENIFTRGFDRGHIAIGSVDTVRSFESFEHFADLLHEIEQMLSVSRTIIFSTVTFSGRTPDRHTRDYYHFSHGQQVAFLSFSTPKQFNNTMFDLQHKFSVLGLPLLMEGLMRNKRKRDSATLGTRQSIQRGRRL